MQINNSSYETEANFNTPDKVKNILLVYEFLKLGGIETFIVRMTKWLSDNGYNVTVFLYRSGGELLEHIENLPNVNIIYNKSENDRFGIKKYLYSLSQKLITFKNKEFDLIFSFNPESFLISYLFRSRIRLSGVYHPDAYSYSRKKERIIRYLKKVDKNFYKKLVFMENSVKVSTEKYLIQKLGDYIFPLPINIEETPKNYGNFKSKKIISIGRIVGFKTYNFYMIDIMERLLKKFPDLTYHIYGYGEQENELKQKINNSTACKSIFFHGPVKYEEMSSVFRDVFCFIGMGTSLIEACSYGIPGIVAVSNDQNAETNGLLNEVPDYECGSRFITDIPINKVEYVLRKLLDASESEYKDLCEKDRKKAEKFNINNIMESFMKHTDSLKTQDRGRLLSISVLIKLLSLTIVDKIVSKFRVINGGRK